MCVTTFTKKVGAQIPVTQNQRWSYFPKISQIDWNERIISYFKIANSGSLAPCQLVLGQGSNHPLVINWPNTTMLIAKDNSYPKNDLSYVLKWKLPLSIGKFLFQYKCWAIIGNYLEWHPCKLSLVLTFLRSKGKFCQYSNDYAQKF